MGKPQKCKVHLDFETKSRVAFKKAGVYRYAEDPSTDVLCMAYTFDDEDVELWTPDYEFPERLYLHVEDGGQLYAHNAQFERLIWQLILENDYGAPSATMEQFVCTAAQARINGLPGALDSLSLCLGLTNKKDHRGAFLIRQLCVPDKKTGEFKSTPELLEELYDYCEQDVRAEREVEQRLRALTKTDTRHFLVSERINDRGIHVDVEFAKAAFTYAKDEQAELASEITKVTDGVLKKARGPKLTQWVYEHLPEKLQGIMRTLERDEKELTLNDKTRQPLLDHPELPKDILVELLRVWKENAGGKRREKGVFTLRFWVDQAQLNHPEMPADVRNLLMHIWDKGNRKLTLDSRTRQLLLDQHLPIDVGDVVRLSDEAQASSTAKYLTMTLAADVDGHRIRGSALYCGATATGRWSGKLIQPQNFPREGFDDKLSAKVRDLIVDNYEVSDICETSGHGVMQTLKRMLRYTLCASEGNTLVASDWSSIEGRALPWLADSPKAREKLDAYRDGVDMYVLMAAKIFRVSEDSVTKEQRQIGKVAELALGYGGGIGAFQAMARGYGISVTDNNADIIKHIWRGANPWAVDFWKELSKAAKSAVHNPGLMYEAGRIRYTYRENYLGGSLFCLLPSGRMLTYPKARVKWVVNKWGNQAPELSAIKAALKPRKGVLVWPRHALWPGLLAENVTQAACACLLRDALLELDPTDKVIGHVHDEIIMEVPEAEGEKYKALLLQVMSMDHGWAEGLPLESDAWIGTHYRK